MHTEKYRRYAYMVICAVGALALAYVSVRFALPLLLPFLLAWGVALLTRPIAMWVHKWARFPVKLCRTLTSLFCVLILLTGIFALTLYLGSEGWRWLSRLAEGEGLADFFTFLFNPLDRLLPEVSALSGVEEKIGEAVGHALNSLIGTLTSWLSGIIAAVPRLFLCLIVTLIATVYVSWDLERVNRTVLSVLPTPLRGRVLEFKRRFMSGVWPYVRSYIILMLLTFGIMLGGLCLLRVEYALLVAVVIALLDPLPVIGVGTVLIPWSLFQLFFGSTPLGIGLAILYVVHEIFRQIAEPRILGKSMGLHPLLTLMLLYGGYALLGLVGLLLLPLLTVTLHVLLTSKETSAEKEKTAVHDDRSSANGNADHGA